VKTKHLKTHLTFNRSMFEENQVFSWLFSGLKVIKKVDLKIKIMLDIKWDLVEHCSVKIIKRESVGSVV